MAEQVRRVIMKEHEGMRLDRALAAMLEDQSRSQCQRLVDNGLVTVDGKRAKSSLVLTGREEVTVTIPLVERRDLIIEQIPLDIIHEDEDLIAVNKPAGMVVHPAAGHDSGTLVNAILGHCPDLAGVGGERRPGIVHRLDKMTSGVIVVAKNDNALRSLQRQFQDRSVEKSYIALVHGHFGHKELLIDAPIGRHVRDRTRMAVISPRSSARSREATTLVLRLEGFAAHTLLECRPMTGRTHQIRVHLAFAGHPVVGDTLYGRRGPNLAVDRHFLHASSLTVSHPRDERRLVFVAELAAALDQIVTDLRAAAQAQ